MDGQQYYAAVKRLGLNPTNIPHVYVNVYEEVFNVPDPANYTPDQRVEIIEKLKERLGVKPIDEDR